MGKLRRGRTAFTHRFFPRAAAAIAYAALIPAFIASMKVADRLLDSQSIVVLGYSWELAEDSQDRKDKICLLPSAL